ncbi:hypothetical protein D3C84_1146230 [compost metagenome]
MVDLGAIPPVLSSVYRVRKNTVLTAEAQAQQEIHLVLTPPATVGRFLQKAGMEEARKDGHPNNGRQVQHQELTHSMPEHRPSS